MCMYWPSPSTQTGGDTRSISNIYIYICVCLNVLMYVCVCVCVCVRERERGERRNWRVSHTDTSIYIYIYIYIYSNSRTIFFDFVHGRMNRVPNETRTHSCRFLNWKPLHPERCPIYIYIYIYMDVCVCVCVVCVWWEKEGVCERGRELGL